MAVRHDFDNCEVLAEALASAVAKDLATGITQRGRAALAVSGGSTPKLFFARLAAAKNLDWSKVAITLVDERWVDEDSTRSNARLVRENLLQGAAAAAKFVPLYTGAPKPDAAAISEANAWQSQLPHPFDAVVLGMGDDGHTASFFPGAPELEAALSSAGPLIALHAEAASEPRITMTLPFLLATHGLYLHIEGAQKADVLAKAQEPAGAMLDMPVRAVLRQLATEVHIYFCA